MTILLRVITLLLTVGLISSAHAQKIDIITKVEKVLMGGSEEGSVAQPQPVNLQADWWRYFNVKDEELAKRIQQLLDSLTTLPEELPSKSAEVARRRIGLIRLNLQALPKARAQPSPELPNPPSYKKSYTLSQLLEIVERLRALQTELQAERDEVAAAQRTLKAASRRIDTLMAAYLTLEATDSRRILRGLEIMAETSATAVAQERLRVRKAALLANEERAKQLANEQAVATERLAVEPNDLEILDQTIQKLQTDLERAKERLLNEESRILGVVGDSPEDKATARNRQQRVVQAAVEEALAKVRLIRFSAEHQLVALLLNNVKIDTQSLRGQLSEWNAQLTAIRRQALTWTMDSERERDRAGESVAGVPREAPFVTSLALINEERLRLAQETLVTLQRLEDELTQTDLIVQLVSEKLARREGGLRSWWARAEYAVKALWNETEDWISTSLFKLGDTPITSLGLLRVVLILTIAWLISYWLRRALKRLGERREGGVDSAAFYTVGRLSHYLIIFLGFIVGLSSIGVDFTNFALVAGAIAIGIGFGLQSIVNNFVSGLILLFERTLKVGDFVELASGVAGEVREINVRSTLINTNDNIDIVVPNSEFMNSKVINWTLSEGYCRIHLPFKVAYGTDKDKVRQAGLEAAEKLPHTLTGIPGKNPGMWLVKFGESSLDFELVVWVTARAVKRPGAVHAAYMWEIESALRRHGIEIPFPQRELRLRSGFRDLDGFREFVREPTATNTGTPVELEKS
jgi:small-conductance mechanosensitive channel